MAETNKIFCEPCEHSGIVVEASIWCTDCCEGFCEECVKGHKLTKILRNHHIITITDHLQTQVENVSQTCAQHSKPFDSFCLQHDELLCLKCVQLNHSNCGDILRLDEAVKGVKTSTAIVDIEEQITLLLQNIARGLELNTENKKNIGEKKESIKSTINDVRSQINAKLDQLQENILDELETKYDKVVLDLDEFKDRLHEHEKRVLGLQTQLNGLKTHASDKETFIGMKNVCTSVYSVKNEFNIDMSRIHPDLQLHIHSSTSSLIDELKEFGKIVVQNKCDYAAFIKPLSGQAQLDVQMLDITDASLEKIHTLNLQKGKYSFDIRGCIILKNEYMVFTDYLNKRLIIHDKTREYKKEIKLSREPKHIRVVDENDVVVSFEYKTSYVDIINLPTNKIVKRLSCSSNKWHKTICFHDGKFFVGVKALGGVKELTRDGTSVKTLLPQVHDIGIICVHDNRFHYSRPSDKTIYCTDFDGNLVWEFTDDRLYRERYTTPFAVDGSGNVYVICYHSNLVLGISFDEQNNTVLLDESDGLEKPSAISYNQQNNQLLVCNENNGEAFVFDVKN